MILDIFLNPTCIKSYSILICFSISYYSIKKEYFMHYTGTIWRPPYEAYSALIQVTAGCTHHKCKFCTLYEDIPFKFRMSPLSEVEEDMKELSLYYSNAKRVFFTGANPFVLNFNKLKTLANLVKQYFPNADSIGCFARITDITPKTTEQLSELRQLGYNGITIGVEVGDDTALSFMRKGFGTKEILAECKKLDEVNMEYNFFYLTGLFGAGQSKQGAKNTAAIFIEKLYELKTLIEHLTIPTYFATMGASNCIFVEGNLPKDKKNMITQLENVIKSADETELRKYRENLQHL